MSSIGPVALKITISGLPPDCPSCETPVESWPLGSYLGQIMAACPACHVPLGQVMGVPPDLGTGGEVPLISAAEASPGYDICRAHPDGCVNYPDNEHN